MTNSTLPAMPICMICEEIIFKKHSCRYTTIGLVCDKCFPNYDKINKLLCDAHTKSLNVALEAVGKMFGHMEGE